MSLLKSYVYSLACLACVGDAGRVYRTNQNRPDSRVTESHVPRSNRFDVWASLFLQTGAPAHHLPRSYALSPARNPASTPASRNVRMLATQGKGDESFLSHGSLVPHTPALQRFLASSAYMRELDFLLRVGSDTASARGGKTIMGPYNIPEYTEDVWVEKNVASTDERVLYLGGEVDDAMVYRIIAQMLYLDVLSHEDQYLYVNSPGGSVIAGLALYDAMQHVKSNIITVNLGMAASTASLILGAGVRGKRVGVSSSGVMIHQPSSGGLVGAQAQLDKRVDADQIMRIKDVVITMYADMTGHSRERIIEDISYDNYMTAKEALDYGLIDEIIENDPAWDLDP